MPIPPIFGRNFEIMKNLSLTLNVVLLIAVGVLYYLHFKDGSGQPEAESHVESMPPVQIAPGGIYFLNSDSLLDNYEYYKKKKAEIEKRQDRIRTELKSEGDRLERDVESYQQQAPGMMPDQRQKTEESLMMRQQQLMQKKDQLLSQLEEEQSRYSDSLFYRLSAFLKAYNKDKGVHYVLGYQRGGGILYANDSLNITRAVIEGLNKEFKEEEK